MTSPKDDLTKKIADLKAQIAKAKADGKDLRKDAAGRQLRKQLKRTQRKLALSTKPSHEQKVARVAKVTDMIAKRLSELTQGAKKVQANPYVRSLKKKTKSLNKLKKKLDRQAKKAAAKAAPPKVVAAPVAAAPEGEKK